MDFSRDGQLYAEGKFADAIATLVWSIGDVRARLTEATFLLWNLRGATAPFPIGTESEARFTRLINRLTSTPGADATNMIGASVRALDETEVLSVVQEILDLYRVLIIQNANA